MRYGIAVSNAGAYSDVQALVRLAHAAESAGWDGFFLWDHIVFGPEPVVDPCGALSESAPSAVR